jgi:precorrin-3B synthase
MESGDGLLVRVRARCGAFDVDSLAGLAALAARYGNGHLDLTRRANIQIRGIGAADLPALWSRLDQLGLIDESAEAEAVRNVVVSPLTGLDPSEVLDVRPIARALSDALTQTPALWALPGKFGFVVDGGGMLPLDGERGDIRLKAVRGSGGVQVAVGIDRPGGTEWLGLAPVEDAAAAAVRVAEAFLAVSPPGRRWRLRDVPETALEPLRCAASASLSASSDVEERLHGVRALGPLTNEDRVFAVGVAAPFGRLKAAELELICAAATKCGAGEVRISPWRCLYIPVRRREDADAVVAAAAACGLITTADDPILAIDACPGAPGCRSTELDTRAAAYQLAPMLAELGCASAHVSGCAKGCARSAPADLVLVGNGGCFGIMRYDTAQAAPRAFLSPADLRKLRQLRPL